MSYSNHSTLVSDTNLIVILLSIVNPQLSNVDTPTSVYLSLNHSVYFSAINYASVLLSGTRVTQIDLSILFKVNKFFKKKDS